MIYYIVKETFQEHRNAMEKMEREKQDKYEKRIKEILSGFEEAMEETRIILSDVRRDRMERVPEEVKLAQREQRVEEQFRTLMGSRSLLKDDDQCDKGSDGLKISKKPTKVTTLDKNSIVFVSSRPDVLSFLSTSPIYKRDEYPITLEKADFSKRGYRHVSNFVDLRTYDMGILNTPGKVGIRKVNVLLELELGSKAFANNVFRYKDSDLTDESKEKFFKYLVKTGEDDNGISRYVIDFDNPTILNVGLYGANAVGTLVALAPWNNCKDDFFKEKARQLNIISKDDNEKIIQLPVAKEQRARDNVVRTADSARFIYAHNPFFNNYYSDNPSEVIKDIRYWENGRHIKGSRYWYKDKDGLPSIIRPMQFNSFISVISKYGYNFRARMPLDGALLAGTGAREEEIPTRVFSNIGLTSNTPNRRGEKSDLYLTNDVLEQLNESLKDKIVVTDFKRINLTSTDIDTSNYRCPILESYLEDGYTVINTDHSEDQVLKEIFEDMLTRIRIRREELYGGVKEEKDIFKDTIDRATGKISTQDVVENILKNNLANVDGKVKGYDILSNLTVEEGGFKTPSHIPLDSFGNSNYMVTPHYEDSGFSCRDILVRSNPVLAPDLVNTAKDFIETESGYTIGKNEILIRSQLPSGATALSVIKSFSVCLVKHTIIDTKDFESSSEDVLYDANSELLIGKVYRNVDKTRDCIAKYQHPLSKGYFDKQVGGYNFKYLRNVDDSNPRDIYINVLGNVEHVVAEDTVGYETVVEIYKEGKKLKTIPKVDFEKEGIFYTESLAITFSKYDTKLQYNHNLNALGKSELVSLDLENKRLIAERAAINDKNKHDLEMLKIEAEIEKLAMNKDLEKEKYMVNLTKSKMELEKINLSIEELEKEKLQLLVKLESEIRAVSKEQPVTGQLLDLANVIGKSAAAGTAVMNLYRVIKSTL